MSTPEVRGFRLRGRGLGRVLGSLELEVMQVVWKAGPSAWISIRDVRDAIARRKDVSFNAVMTVMNRLVDKGLLRRRGTRASYTYAARWDRATLERRVSRRVTESLVRDFGSFAVAQFVDALDRVDPERVDELEKLLRERRARR